MNLLIKTIGINLNSWYTKANEVLKKAESLSDKNFKVIVKWNYIKSGGVSYNKCYALPF